MIQTELICPIAELLKTQAKRWGSKAAYRDTHRVVSYEQLLTRTANIAAGLNRLGFLNGDRAAILIDNSVEVVESTFAITRAEGISLTINPRATEREIEYMLEDCGARIVFTDTPHVDLILGLSERLPALERVIVVDRGSGGAVGTGAGTAAALSSTNRNEKESRQPQVETTDYAAMANAGAATSPPDGLELDAPAYMCYTSGTTGRPKGVVLSQRNNLWVVAACWAPIVGYSHDDYILSPLPLFHSYALNATTIATIAVGATTYITEKFSASGVLEMLRDEPITLLLGVPTMFQYLLAHQNTDPHPINNKLRVCVTAGSIMTADLNQSFEDVFKVPLLDGYGITETATMVTENWLTGTRVMGCCGLPLPGSSIRIVSPDTGLDVGPEKEGELWVSGPHLMLGYYNRPEDTKKVLVDGWYHTGDLAVRDECGYIRITGRKSELIIRGGENISPAEVEEVILTHPGVFDCAVVGVAHKDLGEVPVVFIVPADPNSFSRDDVLSYCSKYLSDYKIPAYLFEIDSIPRTGSGKTIRYKLKQMVPKEATID